MNERKAPLAGVFGPIAFAYVLYASHWEVWLWSLPVAALRVVAVLMDGQTAVTAALLEISVEALRVIQFVLAVAAAKGLSPRKLLAGSGWRPSSRDRLTLRTVLWELAGYVIVFGGMNLLIYWVLGHEGVVGILRSVTGSSAARERLVLAATLALKNLVLIPVSVLAMLRIFRLLP